MTERTLLRIPTRVALIAETSGGWWVRFEGSWERLFAGPTKPDLSVGDTVFVDIVKPEPPHAS
jgi:hypothetical protein